MMNRAVHLEKNILAHADSPYVIKLFFSFSTANHLYMAISPYLPISPHISPHLPALHGNGVRAVLAYLPTPPPHLPYLPHISPYLAPQAMEYAPCSDCFSLLCFSLLSSLGFLEEAIARFFLGEAVCGLQYLHSSGISHRDLKPEMTSPPYTSLTSLVRHHPPRPQAAKHAHRA